FESIAGHFDVLRSGETSTATKEFRLSSTINTLFPPSPPRDHAFILPLENGLHIHSREPCTRSPASGIACVVSDLGTGNHGLGGRASRIDTGAAKLVRFNQSDTFASPCE